MSCLRLEYSHDCCFYPDGIDSYASEEVCTELARGVPIFLKASVSTTDAINGAIHLKWLEPLDFDSIANPGPYRYQLYRSDDLIGAAFTDPVLIDGIHNVSYIDTLYNTLEKPRIYKLGLFNYNAISDQWNLIGAPARASSPFLTLKPGDNEVDLTINTNVPWENYQYIILRKTFPANDFDTIAFTTKNNYLDVGLTNGVTYCYKVKCLGKYGLDTIPHPLINFSQEACAIPIDTFPPCPPVLTLFNNCDSARNELRWTNPNHSCANDVIKYNIYYTPGNNENYQLIKTIENPDDTVFWHYPEQTLAGCYIVTAVDSFQNESSKENFVCADICDYYKLPNSFSPDGNGVNDVFKPFPYQLVEKIDIKIYSRYGALIYQTSNPDINWDGRNMMTKQLVASGVYYYVCDVWEYRITGLEVRNLTGFIHVFSGGGSELPKK
ncbi:MAG: gliding motility-associated C-terminal domain-containing protein [Bacteroidales bacterium]